MLTLPHLFFGFTLSVGTIGAVIFPVTTGSLGGSYSSVDTSSVSTCTSLAVGVGVSTGTVSNGALLIGSGYFFVTGLVVNCLAFSNNLFARIRVDDGPLDLGLLLLCTRTIIS